MKKPKYYGRTNINKLDWMLAIGWILLALGTIWLAIGLSIGRAGAATFPGFRDFGNGIAFNYFLESSLNIVAIVNGILFYGALFYLLLAIMFLVLKKKMDRMPGAFATYFALLGFAVLFSLTFELGFGESKDAIPAFWAFGEIFFLAALFAFSSISVFATFSSYNVSLGEAKPEKKEPAPVVKEEKPVKEPAKKEEIKQEPVKKEEPKAEPAKKEEPKEEPADEEEGGFNGFGPRRRKVPFEEKLGKADKETKERYKMILDALEEFELSERVSVPGHSFSYKKEKLVFITFGGNTLKAYIAVDPKSYAESTIPVRDASKIKKFEQTPSMLYIKSNLAARRVVDLAKEALSNYKVPRKIN